MKTSITLRLSILPLLLLPFLASAQQKTTFTIADPFKKSMYGDQRVNRMKFKDLKAALLTGNDEGIVHDVRTLESKSTASAVLNYTGLALVTLGATMNLLGTASEMPSNNGWGRSSSTTSSSINGLGFMVAGVGLELVGAVVHSGYRSTLKHAMRRHNELIGGASVSPGTVSIDGSLAPGAMLTVHF